MMLLKMDLIHDLLGYNKIKIVQNPEMFSFSLDSMLLADFIKPKANCTKIIDLGCGNAPIPLFLTLKTKAEIYGVEIQKEVAELAKKSVTLNQLENQIKILEADIKNIHQVVGLHNFDIVVSNPPYFKYLPDSNINKNQFLSIARHEMKIDLEGIILEAQKLLISGGYFYLVHRVERITEVMSLLELYKFGIKRIRFVYPKTNSDNALLFLLEARSGMKTDVKVEKPLYVHKQDEYTTEVLKIFNFQKKT